MNFNERLKKFGNTLLDAVYPVGVKCVFCGEELNNNSHPTVCDECYGQLTFLQGKLCVKCGGYTTCYKKHCPSCKSRSHEFKKAFSVFQYDTFVRGVIHNYKFGNRRYMSDTLAKFMVDRLKSANISVDIVTAVPLHRSTLHVRSFNQSELLARHIAQAENLPYDFKGFVKTRKTAEQARLSYTERLENLKDSYLIKRNSFENKTVLLVDDVYTTGATSDECSRMLKLAGAANVYVLTCAHVGQPFEIDN